jgi:prefoldin subunit 5
MVQRLVANNRALSEQVSLLHSAVETLSRASSCDSTLTSIADTLEKVKKLQEANPPPIPAEVIQKLFKVPMETKRN